MKTREPDRETVLRAAIITSFERWGDAPLDIMLKTFLVDRGMADAWWPIINNQFLIMWLEEKWGDARI